MDTRQPLSYIQSENLIAEADQEKVQRCAQCSEAACLLSGLENNTTADDCAMLCIKCLNNAAECRGGFDW